MGDKPVWKDSPHSKMYAALKVITEDPDNAKAIDPKALEQAHEALADADSLYERRVWARPAFDKRDPNPRKDYGIGGVQIGFVLIGPTASVSFVILTNWYLRGVIGSSGYTMGADVSVHRDVPEDWMKESEFMSSSPCDWRPGGTCWSDGSVLAAADFLELLIAEGMEAVWERMATWMPENERVAADG